MEWVVENIFLVFKKNEVGYGKDVNLGEDEEGVENNSNELQIWSGLGPTEFNSDDQGQSKQLWSLVEKPNEALPTSYKVHQPLLTLPLTMGKTKERTRKYQRDSKRWKRRAYYSVCSSRIVQDLKKCPFVEVKTNEEIKPPQKTLHATHEGIDFEHPNLLTEAVLQPRLSSRSSWAGIAGGLGTPRQFGNSVI